MKKSARNDKRAYVEGLASEAESAAAEVNSALSTRSPNVSVVITLPTLPL